jgi:transcriptional regulator with XRE-family HTH domain
MDPQQMEQFRKRFGERIRYLREMRGWQLEDLAARLGKSTATISRIENGKQNLTMIDIVLIAQALEVAPSVLFGPPDEPTNVALQVAKRSALRFAKKGKEAMQQLHTVIHDAETFAAR